MTFPSRFSDLDKRASEIFRHIVEYFLNEGEPIGSRTLSRSVPLSPATIRNVMADLTEMGLLQAPHISAGRLPSDLGLRLFIDGILERGSLNDSEQAALISEFKENRPMSDMLEQTSALLSGLSASAGLVVAPTYHAKPIRHVEFISLASDKAMVILVAEDGSVENRVLDIESGVTLDMLRAAGTFLSEHLNGRSLPDMRDMILDSIRDRKDQIATLTRAVVEAGIAAALPNGKLIVRGQSKLIDSHALDKIERLQILMDQLEAEETVSKLLSEAHSAKGVKIFIGAENSIFAGSGYSLILSPFHAGGSDRTDKNQIVGAIGVIGPARLNYAKIIPSINFMAEYLSRRMTKPAS